LPPLHHVVVKPQRLRPFLARHPWVHRASLVQADLPLPVGAPIDLTAPDGSWIARGLYNPHGNLRVRLYTWDRQEALDEAFFVRRLDEALARRRRLPEFAAADAALRLVYSEADGVSGLIVDRYADALVVQATSAVIEPWLPALFDALQSRLAPRAIVLRTDPKLQRAENFALPGGLVRGSLDPAVPVRYRQNDLLWEVDLVHGQKTGAYLDQRENHAAAARYAAGRRVLDVCCHSGGFALVAARRGAREVLGVDSSAHALELARRHARDQQIEGVEFRCEDCFDGLRRRAQAGEQYEMVILDPPRLAGARDQVETALRAYFRLNRSAVDLLPRGGILVTCSCSGRVLRQDFLDMLAEVGRHARRDIVVLEQRGAPADHPLRVSCPESDYLKCLICEVL